jgi:hypothetical protein
VEQSQNEAYQYITDLNCFRIGFKCNGFWEILKVKDREEINTVLL